MANPDNFVEVILPLPLAGTFTYAIPHSMENKCQIGKRVVVQFGRKRIYTGIVYSTHNNKPADFEVKALIALPDEDPIITEKQLKLWEWSSDYYMCSIGEFYKASVPTALRLEGETKVLPVVDFADADSLNAIERGIYTYLLMNETATISELNVAIKAEVILNHINSLIIKGAILIQEEVKQKFKPKLEKLIQSVKVYDKHSIVVELESIKRAKKQHELLQFLWENYFQININEIKKADIVERFPTANTHLKSLIQKGILTEKTQQISRLELDVDAELQDKHALNVNQLTALDKIQSDFQDKDVVLLHGVTSSGKTEIYIHLIEEVIKQGKQALYLLPEIALTSQIIQRLKLVFGDKVGVYHSKFSGNERVEIWNNLLRDEENSYQVIIGVRSSILLPFKNLGLIIVDEEHENTYKQFDPSPRYNARDLSVVLAKFHTAKVLLGSATPSVESYFNAKTGRYALVELMQRHKDIEMPEIVLADVRKAYKKKQMRAHFTPELIDHIEQALLNKEQVILFQNRRGFSPYLECASCGWIPECKFCDVSLTYHKHSDKLVCHYCGYQVNGVYRCGHCNEPNMETRGFGTEKIEDEICLIFPEARVARLDLDSTKGKHGHERIIGDFQNHRVDILIGTQMVAKGLDFGGVTLVGILSADSMLRYPDFRAYERSYQLMAQVSGRAGRKSKQGKVIIQTSDTEHSIIKQVIDNDYLKMYTDQTSERKAFLYPPFTRLIRITIKHKNQQTAYNAGMYLSKLLGGIAGIQVLGPTTPVINRIQNLYLQQIVIKMAKDDKLLKAKKLISKHCDELVKQANFKAVTLIKDVDPA